VLVFQLPVLNSLVSTSARTPVYDILYIIKIIINSKYNNYKDVNL